LKTMKTSRTAHRTVVPSRYVTIPADYFYDDADDVDLTPENK
jgi:hypothetical protein